MTAPLLLIPIALEWLILVTTLTPVILPSRRIFTRVPNLGLAVWFASLLSAGLAALMAVSITVWSLLETWAALESTPSGSPGWFLVFWVSFAPWIILAAAGISLALVNLRIEPVIGAAKLTAPLFEGALRPVMTFKGIEVFEMPLTIPIAFARNRQIVVTSTVRDVLTPDQFEAVLWHELAHIHGHHNGLRKLAGFVRTLSPRLAASEALVAEVERLCEISADKSALRHCREEVLVSARRILQQ